MKVITFILFLCLICPASYALPRFAVQEGVSCSSCHVSPTGGGKRNETGGATFAKKLALKSTRKLLPKDLQFRISKYVATGGDIFGQNTTVLDSPKQNNFTVPKGNLYVEVTPFKYLTGYLDYDFANTYNRETFLMAHKLPFKTYARVGRFGLPYGLRIDDDSSPIRNALNMTFANQDIGAEIGMIQKSFEMVAAVSNGVPAGITDENFAKAITSSASWIGKFARLGGSFHWNKRSANRLTQGAIHGGAKLWRFLLLAEADLQQNFSYRGNPTTWLIAGFSELSFQATSGLYIRALYDYVDPDFETPDNFEQRFGGGVDLYPVPHAKASLVYRHGTGTVNFTASDELTLRLGFFF